MIKVNGLDFHTTNVCPNYEEYEIYKDNTQVGYFMLHNGIVICDFPNKDITGESEVFRKDFGDKSKNEFLIDERLEIMEEIANIINDKLLKGSY